MGNETGEATKRSNSEPQTFEGMVSFIFLVRLKCFPEIEVQRVTYYSFIRSVSWNRSIP